MKKIILDCETFSLAQEGFCKIFEITTGELLEFCLSFNEHYPDRHHLDYNDWLYNHFKSIFGDPINEYLPYAFHLTRKFNDQNYERGLLPTFALLDELIKRVNAIALRHELNQLNRSTLLNKHMISLKFKMERDGGPWGFVIFSEGQKRHFHKKISGPEILFDIINSSYANDAQKLIFDEIEEQTRPCALKFVSQKIAHPDNLCYVLSYIFKEIRKENSGDACGCSFNINMWGHENIKVEKFIYLD